MDSELENSQQTSTTFLEIIHHPHSGISDPEFKFRDLPSDCLTTEVPTVARCLKGSPWAPFRTRADFEFAETVIQAATHAKTIDRLIKGIRNHWTDPGHSQITFRNVKHFNQSMKAARKFVVQVYFSLFLQEMFFFLIYLIVPESNG